MTVMLLTFRVVVLRLFLACPDSVWRLGALAHGFPGGVECGQGRGSGHWRLADVSGCELGNGLRISKC
jgi:hypothetical protein